MCKTRKLPATIVMPQKKILKLHYANASAIDIVTTSAQPFNAAKSNEPFYAKPLPKK